MIIVTSSQVTGREIQKTLGLVVGSTIRSRHVGADIAAGLRSMVGGEIKGYTKMLAESRDEAIQRMVEEAKALGANAVVDFRLSTSAVAQNAAEIVAYGTAVVLSE